MYWTSVSFSDSTEGTEAPVGIPGLITDKKGGIRATDILNLRSSVDFNRKIAANLIASEFYSKLRLDLDYLGFESTSARKIEKFCKFNKNCVLENLSKRVLKFYQISDKDRSGINFSLEVKALDVLTANVLLREISRAILETRTDVVRYRLKDEATVNSSILIEKKKEVDVTNYYELQDLRDRLESELKEIQTKIDHQSNIIASVQDRLGGAEASYQLSKKVADKKVNIDEMNVEMRRRELKEKIINLNSDLIALEDVSINHSEKDKEILVQIKKDMTSAKKRLKLLGAGDTQTNLDQFVKQNDEKMNGKELDYRVVKDQLEFAKQNYEEMLIKKRDVLGNKIKTEQSLDILKPSIEFIKGLEVKIEQLKLRGLSVNPDVRFDSYSGSPEGVKKIGLILIMGYYVILQLLLAFIHLVVRFYIDNNIYDEEDLISISKNLKIIGNGPNY